MAAGSGNPEGSFAGNLQALLALIARTPERPGRRRLIGIAGPPGSGKTTLAADMVARLEAERPGQAVLLPMDGFPLDNTELDRRGLRAAKGSPQTFDVDGFVAKVREVACAGRACRVPRFDRAEDRTLPDAGIVPADARVVVIEGNYLLLQEPGWEALRPLLDATVMLAPPEPVLEARLLRRWRDHGLSPAEALQRTRGNDLVNARRVLAASTPADLRLSEAPPPPRERSESATGRPGPLPFPGWAAAAPAWRSCQATLRPSPPQRTGPEPAIRPEHAARTAPGVAGRQLRLRA